MTSPDINRTELDIDSDKLERTADVLGNFAMARAYLYGVYDDDKPEDSTRSRRTQPPYRRRPTGRSVNEGKDSELDQEWPVESGPLSQEQQELNRQGLANARRILEDLRIAREATLNDPNGTRDKRIQPLVKEENMSSKDAEAVVDGNVY